MGTTGGGTRDPGDLGSGAPGDSPTPAPRVPPPLADANGPQFRLLVHREHGVLVVPLEGHRWVVGRAEDCDIRLADQTASRHHVVLERHGDAIRYRDLGGTNPLLVNGRPLREGELRPGATLLIGMTRVTFERSPPRARWRVVDDTRAPSVSDREVLEDLPPRPARGEPIHFGGLPPFVFATAASVLDRFLGCFDAQANVDEAARALLDAALDATGHDAGLLGRFDSAGKLDVLAALHRGGGEIVLSQQVVLEARRRHLPALLYKDTPEELLSIPLQGPFAGILVLAAKRGDAPRGQAGLRLARSIAQMVASRLQDVVEQHTMRQELQQLRFHGSPAYDTVLASARLQTARLELRQSIPHRLGVFLHGEEGTEREDLARYLHAESPNAAGPFVPFYCSVVPAHRADEELLGPSGALARAAGGTLFLDQPETLPESVQHRLAQALGSATSGPADATRLRVRTVAAASDALAEGEPGALVPALAERLLGIRVTIPPLRDHPTDILALTEMILGEMGPAPDGVPRSLTDATRQLLLRYRWPGNARELRRVLEGAAARAGVAPIAPRHLPPEIREPSTGSLLRLPTLADVERRHILYVMESVGGNRKRAAEVLGIATSTLYERLKSFRR